MQLFGICPLRLPWAMQPWSWLLPVVAVLAGTVPSRVLAVSENLVPSPGFETGSLGPAGWERPDKIAYFWEDSGNPGKCVVFDTRVTWEQRYPELAKTAQQHATTNRNNNHSTNNYNNYSSRTTGDAYRQEQLEVLTRLKAKGVGAWASPIPVKPGNWYLLDADYYGPAGAKASLCVRGYRRFGLSEVDVKAKESWFFQINGMGAWFEDAAYGTSRRAPQPLDYVRTFRTNFFCEIPQNAGKTWQHLRRVIQIPEKPKEKKGADAGAMKGETASKLGKTSKLGLDLPSEKKARQEEAHPEYRSEFIVLRAYADKTPAGIYRFDNIAVYQLTPEEAQKLLRALDQAPAGR